MLLIICIILVQVSGFMTPISDFDEDLKKFNNFNNKQKLNWDHWSEINSETGLPILEPSISVQSVLAEGIGWKGSLGEETSNHVIITVNGVHPDTGLSLPYPSSNVFIKLDGHEEMECIIEDGNGNGEFTRCDLSHSPFTFKTNSLGRFSFSLPITSDHESSIPALLIRTDFMPIDDWIVCHVDADAHHKLSQITEAQLKTANSEISHSSALELSNAISFLMETTKDNSPISHEKDSHFIKRDHIYQPPKRKISKLLNYDPIKNRISTYMVSNWKHSSKRQLKRSFIPVAGQKIYKRSLDDSLIWQEEFKSLQKREIEDSSNYTLIAGDQSSNWSLWSLKSGKGLIAILKDKWKKFIHVVIDNVEKTWEFVSTLLLKAKITYLALYKVLQDFFKFEDILHTQMFLSSYYHLLAPLGFRGLHLIRKKTNTGLFKLINGTEHLFADAIKSHGGIDMTIDEFANKTYSYMPDKLIGAEFPFFNASSTANIQSSKIPNINYENSHSADGRTNMIIDRIINNIPHVKILDGKSVNTSVIKRYVSILNEMGRTIFNTVGVDTFSQSAIHMLNFTSDASFMDKMISQVLNHIRSLSVLSERYIGEALESIAHLLPIYWNLATSIMFMPIKIPFVYKWYTTRYTNGMSDLTILDLLTLLGGSVSTWTYKLYNDNYPPYTELDIEVLRSNKEPELIIHTWGKDPRTSDENDTMKHVHRLGIHDWIPKMHQGVVSTINTMLCDTTHFLSGANVKKPDGSVKLPQLFSTLTNVMGRVGYYPFTQINTTDAAVIRKSKENPDSRFLGWWLCTVFEDVVNTVRPFMPDIYNEYPLLHIVNVITGTIPTLAFGLKIQVDQLKAISKIKDIPRKIVVNFSWVQTLFMVVNSFVPFIESNQEKKVAGAGWFFPKVRVGVSEEVLRSFVFKFKIFRDASNQFLTILKSHMTMGFHIVGLLSSSWQGGNVQGGLRREVLDKLAAKNVE